MNCNCSRISEYPVHERENTHAITKQETHTCLYHVHEIASGPNFQTAHDDKVTDTNVILKKSLRLLFLLEELLEITRDAIIS